MQHLYNYTLIKSFDHVSIATEFYELMIASLANFNYACLDFSLNQKNDDLYSLGSPILLDNWTS